jgi:Na+-driven multidrug efflux pump
MKLTKEQRSAFYVLLFPALIERILSSLFHTIDKMMLGQMKASSTLAVATLFSNNETLYPLLIKMFITTAVSLPFINCYNSISGALREASDTVAPLISSMTSLWLFRGPVVFL